MLDVDIDDIAQFYKRVLLPLKRPEKQLRVTIPFYLDTEFNQMDEEFDHDTPITDELIPAGYRWVRHPFLQVAMQYEDHTYVYGPLLTADAVLSFTFEGLLDLILKFLRESGANLDEIPNVTILAHKAISEFRFATPRTPDAVRAILGGSERFFGMRGYKYRGISWNVKDTGAIFQMSLEKLTADSPITKLPISHEERIDPYKFYEKDPARQLEYAKRDVQSLRVATEFWRKEIWERFHVDILGDHVQTCGGIAMRIFRSQFMNGEPIDPTVTVKKRPRPETRFPADSPHRKERYLAGRAYHGARRETLIRGLTKGNIDHYDFKKLYITSMAACPLPGPHTRRRLIRSLRDLRYPGFVQLDSFVHPPNSRICFIPQMSEKYRKLVFPLEGRKHQGMKDEPTCTTFEARLAIQHGTKLRNLHGIVYLSPYDDRINKFAKALLTEIDRCGKPGQIFYKNLGVDFVGKLAEKDKIQEYDELGYAKPKITVASPHFSPTHAALILGYARTAEAEALLDAHEVVYYHTDSAITVDSPEPTPGPIMRELVKVGGGLALKWSAPWIYTPRAAVYYARETHELGKPDIVKSEMATHGIHGDNEIERFFQDCLANPEGWDAWLGKPAELIDDSGKRPRRFTVIGRKEFMELAWTTWRQHRQNGIPLYAQLQRITSTTLGWDDKRKLVDPAGKNQFKEPIRSIPWRDLDELLANTYEKPTDKATRAERIKRLGELGRPRTISAEILTEIRKLRASGMSLRNIEKRYAGRCSKSAIQRALSRK